MSKIIYCFFLFFGTITELLLNISRSFWIKQLHYQLAKTTDGILLHSYQLMNLVSTKLRVATSFVFFHSHQLIPNFFSIKSIIIIIFFWVQEMTLIQIRVGYDH